jgi:drug/metabolite transporter (DMT)-like permease
LACGVCYGVAAFLVKLVTGDFSGGLPHLLTSWPIYAVAVIGAVGFVLNQDAFQAVGGLVVASVMAIITAADPLVSIALGYVFLDEKLSSSPAGIVGEVASLVVMVIGIVIIAHHAPQVIRQRRGCRVPGDPASHAGSNSPHPHGS